MLGPGRYLLGVVEILLLGGFAWLGGAALSKWLLPRFEGVPAHLATTVLALALLIWAAELLGTFGAFDPLPYLLLVGAAGVVIRAASPAGGAVGGTAPEEALATGRGGGSPAATGPAGQGGSVPVLIALLVAAIAVVLFALEAKTRLSTGMTGFDSTWYHGPFAAGFFQSGDTWDLHFIAPQFFAWFYPANAEIFHAIGMLAFDRDVLSPLLNLGWFAGCLVACWCIGRPYGVAPWSLALGAIALSVPALADQAGEARNDIVGIFFLLAAVAIAVNGGRDLRTTMVAGLAVGLAAGTKLNFLLPAAVLVIGFAVIAPRGERWRSFGAASLAALAGGGYWYLRNLIHTGNPLPWIDSLGPISLPAPDQALGGREAHSVLGYLTDGAVWSDWFLPGLRDGLWLIWPLLLAAALAGLVLALAARRFRGSFVVDETTKEPRNDSTLVLVELVGLATVIAWLVAPTSASGPDGMPRGFESGLRYLAPALVLGLALLPTSPRIRAWLSFDSDSGTKLNHALGGRRGTVAVVATVALVLAVAVGYPVQRHYLENRYENPSFTAPGLNAAFAWARDVSDSRIATTSTRQYPLFGTDLSNQVEYLGTEQPHGGFESPTTCRQYLQLLDQGNYDYVIATRDREEQGKPPYPPSAKWTKAAGAQVLLKEPPTVVFALQGKLDPSACR